MSIQDSNLSGTGFDYVVAVTQDSINGTLEEYLFYQHQTEVILCYIYDPDGNPVPKDYEDLKREADGVDPFSIPDNTPVSDGRLQSLNNANFAFAIKAKLGLPPGVPPAELPNIVTLQPGQSSVQYTMMFAEFVATEYVYGPKDRWVNQPQPEGTGWYFSGPVNLNFQDTDFTSLPAPVQEQIKDVGNPDQFSIQQLYFDLNNSALEQGFKLVHDPSNSTLNSFLTGDFISTYWSGYKKIIPAGRFWATA